MSEAAKKAAAIKKREKEIARQLAEIDAAEKEAAEKKAAAIKKREKEIAKAIAKLDAKEEEKKIHIRIEEIIAELNSIEAKKQEKFNLYDVQRENQARQQARYYLSLTPLTPILKRDSVYSFDR